LKEYVELLIDRLREADPSAVTRIAAVVGGRRARIVVDKESVEVSFGPSGLVVNAITGDSVDGTGTMTRATALDLLDGYVEVTTAILDGGLEVVGSVENVARIGQAIEILLDGAVRAPAMQDLGRDFRDDPCRPARNARSSGPFRRRTPFYAAAPSAEEVALLSRLDLLP
jgi:hypothetical protein